MRTFVAACTVALLLSGASHAAVAQSSPATAQASVPASRSGPATPAPPVADVPIESSDAAADASVATDGFAATAPEPRDRFEKLNRGIWGFNQFVDRIILKPVSSGYRAIIPRVARRGISHVFSNLGEPWSFVNNLLQAKPGRALNNLGRFVVNTTIGIGGLADHATKLGIAARPEDFGQTLAVWGVRNSAYVVLPVLGPSTVRDGIGTGVAFVADPYQIALNQTDLAAWTKRGIAALSIVSIRADLTESGADAFLQSSLDPYAAARSAFWQRRTAAIANQDSAGPADAATTGDGTDAGAVDPSTGITAPATGAVPGSLPAAGTGTGTDPIAPDTATTPDPAGTAQGPTAGNQPHRVATPD